ncbi:MAG TPA: sigma-54 dependent transcriptional regulator [Xanthobacteraceae bacterium]|nr:sigma-54 dependent transcriptional regulator [Xanthobacteraceae bacterium]
MPRILIIDDDDALRAALATSLSDLGHQTAQAADGPLGLAWLQANRADAVLLDLRMPGMDGLEVLQRILEPAEAPPVAILTAVPTAENTIEAMRIGAADHITKPIGRADLAALLERMLPAADARPLPETARPVDGLVGASAAMREVHKAIGMLADSEATVLILGETGTGKEVVARAMHRHGRRAAKPFVPVNCAAIPAELLESQLFGHVRGAFTGAVADRTGFFREADGGVLFLDEIGDMDLALQAKLLRVLQERVVTPVGGRPLPVDVRVIAATHRDLREAVRGGSFREDLYYRLGVVPLRLPPLRERCADIVPLAEHFLRVAAGRGPRKQLAADAAALLVAHLWHGNVRELRNAIERVAALVRRPVIRGADFAFLHAEASAAGGRTDLLAGTLPEAVTRLETEMIRHVAASDGNRARAAERLGIRRQLLYDKIARLGLAVSGDRTGSVSEADSGLGTDNGKSKP